jgi:low affinity Fe/Cu permease
MTRRSNIFELLARKASRWTGNSLAFILAVATIVVWLATGPFYEFSDTWQLVINTGTTIITFLMVFLIQRSQNIDAQAIQIKLNELVAAAKGASNRMINVEDFSEHELDLLHQYYSQLAKLAKKEVDLMQSHSVEEASHRHKTKYEKGTADGQ